MHETRSRCVRGLRVPTTLRPVRYARNGRSCSNERFLVPLHEVESDIVDYAVVVIVKSVHSFVFLNCQYGSRSRFTGFAQKSALSPQIQCTLERASGADGSSSQVTQDQRMCPPPSGCPTFPPGSQTLSVYRLSRNAIMWLPYPFTRAQRPVPTLELLAFRVVLALHLAACMKLEVARIAMLRLILSGEALVAWRRANRDLLLGHLGFEVNERVDCLRGTLESFRMSAKIPCLS